MLVPFDYCPKICLILKQNQGKQQITQLLLVLASLLTSVAFLSEGSCGLIKLNSTNSFLELYQLPLRTPWQTHLLAERLQ